MNAMIKIRYILILPLVCLLAACTPSPENVDETDARPDIYPDYVGVTVPCNIAPSISCFAAAARRFT